MNTRTRALSFALMLTMLGLVLALGGASPTARAENPAAPNVANWVTTGNSIVAGDFLGTTNSQALVFKANNAERMRIQPNGRVGIGTNNPQRILHVNSANSGLRLQSSGTAVWTTTEYQTDARLWHTGVGGSAVGNDVKSKYYIFDGTAGQFRMAIDTAGNVGIGTTAPTSKLEIAAQDGLAITGYQPFLTLRDSNGGNSRAIIQGANSDMGLFPDRNYSSNPAMLLKGTTGNVGIGTIAPSARLSVVTSGAPQPSVQGISTAFKIGTAAGTVPFALKQNAAESNTPTMAYFETNNGDLGYFGANTGTFVVGGTAGKAIGFNVNGSTRAMTIASNGVVAIGTTNPTAKLHVHSAGTTISTYGLRVDNGNGDTTLSVDDAGNVGIGNLYNGHCCEHVCYFGPQLSNCGSAAEYVPSIDSGSGFPETADLVSIVPTVKNPYNDPHGPFVVQKSTTACDPNMLGYIVNPEKGADGVKKNDHYLPLAIYGYFPAKVTTANGAIKRGDPLTSSSKPGYAMKATGACKIIGYALEDANADGTIQVFAHLGENSAPQVAALQTQVDALLRDNLALKQENSSIKQMLSEMDVRLKALERSSPVAQNLKP